MPASCANALIPTIALLRTTGECVSALSVLSADTGLRLTAEAMHRFDDDATVHVSGTLDTDVSTPDSDRNRIRLGAELGHRLGEDALLSASLHASTGSEPGYLGSLSWKTRF